MHQKRSSIGSLSTKRFTLSLAFLKKRMSSPIGKFAHKGITGKSINPVFSLGLVTGMQGRGNSALQTPPSPYSALNECDLCRKIFPCGSKSSVFSLFQLSVARFVHWLMIYPVSHMGNCFFPVCLFPSFQKWKWIYFFFIFAKHFEGFGWTEYEETSVSVIVNNVVCLSPNSE